MHDKHDKPLELKESYIMNNMNHIHKHIEEKEINNKSFNNEHFSPKKPFTNADIVCYKEVYNIF